MKYEYLVVQMAISDDDEILDSNVDVLNEHGEEGWGLIAVVPMPDVGNKARHANMYFKRPKS